MAHYAGMEAMTKAPEDVTTAVWQAHRIRCLELAAAFGTKPEDALGMADRIGMYILVRSDLECKQTNATKVED